MSVVPRSRNRLARRLGWLAVASLVAASLVPSTFAAEKITICHATGAEGHFVPIDVDAGAGDLHPHLDSNGSPLNGHEGDFLLPKAGFDAECNAIAPTNPPTEAPTLPPTEAPTLPPTEAPTLPPTEAPTEAPTGGVLPTEGVPTQAPTGEVGGATATPATTLPPTDTLGDTAAASGGDSWRIVLLALAATLAAALLLTPARVVRKDR
jgi:hypothetical protein